MKTRKGKYQIVLFIHHEMKHDQFRGLTHAG